jgi:hypothetical protein
MVRFSDLLGRGGDDDKPSRPEDKTPNEPAPPAPTEPVPPPPQTDDQLQRLAAFANELAAVAAEPTAVSEPEPEPEPEPKPSAALDQVTVDQLGPVDDDLLPRKRRR